MNLFDSMKDKHILIQDVGNIEELQRFIGHNIYRRDQPPAPSEYTPVAFAKLADYLQKLPPGDTEQKIRTGFKELVFLCDEKGEEKGCREMRKRFAAYTKGIPDGSRLRQELVQASTIEEYKAIIQNYFNPKTL